MVMIAISMKPICPIEEVGEQALEGYWQWMLATLSVATMVTGNLIAFVQTNISVP